MVNAAYNIRMEGRMRYIEFEDGSLAALLDGWSEAGGGVFALLPEAEKDRLPSLQAACRARGLGLVGAIFPALIRAGQFVTRGGWLLRMPEMPPYFLLEDINGVDGPAVGRLLDAAHEALGRQVEGAARPTLFMIFDSMVPNVGTLLDDLYLELSSRVDYAGVNAGSETFLPMPCLFDASRVVGGGVLGMLVPEGVSAVLEHGFQRPERAMSATSTEGNRIAMIDWRPAFEVYREIVLAEYGVDLTPDNFSQLAVHFPFGIVRAVGDVLVRIPVGFGEDGALSCIGEIPENSVLVLLKAPEACGNGCIDHLAVRLGEAVAPAAFASLLLFYCAGRRMHLGSGAETELSVLQAQLPGCEMAGALSLGEIGSTVRRGYPMFHNATLVGMPWPDR